MFRPQIQKTKTLFFIACLSIASVYLVSQSHTYIEKDGIDDKIKATEIMQEYINSIKNNNMVSMSSKDIYNTGLVGLESSNITTVFSQDKKNFLDSKIACTHPNFSALVVHLFKEAEISAGDTVAVSMTGSFPGANLAFFATCEALGVYPVILSSLGSSSWGANRENFTWIDIESYLFENKFINHKSLAVSIGGENDLGENLSDKGIEIIEENIIANNFDLINENSLKENIDYKMNMYASKLPIEDYSAFINIGGGSSSIGFGSAKDSMKVGVLFPIEIDDILDKNKYFDPSLAYHFMNKGVAFINIKNINILGRDWDLYPPNQSIAINNGKLFYETETYNLKIIILVLVINLGLITGIGFYSHQQIKRRMKNEEYDSVL